MVPALSRPGPDAPRTRLRRLPHKARDDVRVLHAVLDAGRVAHVAVVEQDGQPLALPSAYARDGERLLLHGSTASRLFRLLAAGVPTCVTVTLLDGLVLARSAFESSMHYRCAMVFGRAEAVHGPAKLAALERVSERLLPGRWAEVRAPSAKELGGTTVVAVALDEWSVKVSNGWPADDPADLDRPVWAGVVPVREAYGEPLPAPDLRGSPPLPGYVRAWGA